MPCPHSHARRSRVAAVAALFLTLGCSAITGRRVGSGGYRAPSVVLAYPEAHAALPADKAVVVLRFAQGEAGDPIDPGSFKVTVDGVDRTALFRVAEGEAWGPLGDASAAGSTGVATGVSPGPRTVSARICSARGVCGVLSVVVDVRL